MCLPPPSGGRWLLLALFSLLFCSLPAPTFGQADLTPEEYLEVVGSLESSLTLLVESETKIAMQEMLLSKQDSNLRQFVTQFSEGLTKATNSLTRVDNSLERQETRLLALENASKELSRFYDALTIELWVWRGATVVLLAILTYKAVTK